MSDFGNAEKRENGKCPPLKKSPFPCGIGALPKTWFTGSTESTLPSSISIRSSVFVGRMVVENAVENVNKRARVCGAVEGSRAYIADDIMTVSDDTICHHIR